MEILTALIVAAVPPLLGLFVWWIKYKRAPSKQEMLHQLYDEKNDTMEHVRHLRNGGHHKEADQMLERIRIHAATGWSHSVDRVRSNARSIL